MPRKSNTRNAQGGGSIRQRKDGRWEGRYTVGRDPGTGKQIQKSIYCWTQADVAQRLRKVAASIDDGTYTDPKKLTVGQWLDVWIREYTGNLKPRTIDQYEMHVRLNLKPNLGAISMRRLSAHTIQAVYNKLLRRENPLSPKSIRNLHGVLHSALEQAHKLDYIKFNPCNACTLPRVEKKEMQAIMDEKLDEFLASINGHKYESVYLVDVFTGMRQGEILGLTWVDVDFTKGIIHVRKQLQKERKPGGVYKRVSLKNDKVRRVSPAPFIMDVLKAEQRKQKEWKLRAGGAWDNAMGLVFANEIGRYLAPSTVYNNFKRIVASIGLDAVRMHDLRHTFALLSLENGDDIKSVQEALGHHTAAFTLDVYGHVSEKMLKASAERMQRYINEWKTRQ